MDISKTPNGDHPASDAAHITVLRHGSFIGKRFDVVAGELDRKSKATFHEGHARAIAAPDADALSTILDRLKPDTDVITLGRMTDDRTSAHVVKNGRQDPQNGIIARTQEHFEHAPGEGWLLLDHDTKDMPADVRARIEALGGGVEAIKSIWPDLADADYLVRPSSSGGVYIEGGSPTAATGFHMFVRLADARQSKAALEALTARAWAAGLAWHAVSKKGSLLPRSIIDAAVAGPERLVFTAAPLLGEGVHRRAPESVIQRGIAVSAPSMPDTDLFRLTRRESRRKLKPEAEKAEAAFTAAQVDKLTAQGVARPDAERIIRDRVKGGVLADNDTLQMADGSFARVGDILDAKFTGPGADNLSLPDPVEGVEYGRTTAAIMWGGSHKTPVLVSHAHGRLTVYHFARHMSADDVKQKQTLAEHARAIETGDRPEGSNPQRQITSLPPLMDPDRARARLKVEVTEGLRRPGVTLIEATLGLGKTTAAIEGLKTLFTDAESKGVMTGAVVMAFPMHRLGRQVAKDIEAALPGWSVAQLYGVEAQDPNNPSETVCKQLDTYRERKNLLLDNAELCGACPFAGDCLYQASLGAVADIYITSHERLKAAQTPLQSDQTLLATVIDENPLNALISANRRPVPLAALMAAPTRMTRKGKQAQKIEQEADLHAFRQRLQKTIEAHGPGYLRLKDLGGWTSGDAIAAKALEWGRKIDDEEHPEIGHNRTVTAAAAIFGEIQRSLDHAVPENARLQIKDGENGLEIVISGLRSISGPFREAPVLMLDATANADIAAMLAGEDLAHHVEIRARENIIIEQDPNLSGAKSFFFEKGKPTGNVARVTYFAKAKAMNGRTAVISNKDTIAAMGLPAEIKTGHFNALRGLNEMEGADQAIVIGRTLPPPDAIARMVGAIWGTPCEGDLDHTGKAWRQVTDGSVTWLEQTKAATHSDERGEMILRLIRDAEVTQAIGRLRAVNRANAPVRCTVISDAVLDYPVRLVDLRNTLQAHGVFGPMLDRGVVFLSPAQASRAYPDLYASKQAAAKIIDRITDWATFSIRGLYGKGCPVVELHTPRARNATTAIIAPWVKDAAAEVKRHLPNTAVATLPAQALRVAENTTSHHRDRRRGRETAALALHRRVAAAGLPVGSRLSQMALVLHETQDVAEVARTLRLTQQQADDAQNALYVLGLVDADGALDGRLKRRPLVWAVNHTTGQAAGIAPP